MNSHKRILDAIAERERALKENLAPAPVVDLRGDIADMEGEGMKVEDNGDGSATVTQDYEQYGP